ncbi:MAG: ElyC/SanA/YdcF family protein [Bacteroidales bacterium]
MGTTKFLYNGEINLYYKYRINAAVQLYNSGKVNFILVSGDAHKNNFDEPNTIKIDLMAQGIPESKIYLDSAGVRTLDSVIRSKEIFGQDSITVISQRFHNERAIFIAREKNIMAIGFNATDVNNFYGFTTSVRELFARDKMVLDLIFDKKPKFSGEKIEIK